MSKHSEEMVEALKKKEGKRPYWKLHNVKASSRREEE